MNYHPGMKMMRRSEYGSMNPVPAKGEKTNALAIQVAQLPGPPSMIRKKGEPVSQVKPNQRLSVIGKEALNNRSDA